MENNSTIKGQSNVLITDLSIHYVIKKPASFMPENAKKRYPLIISLHGHGSNERDLMGLSPNFSDDLFWVSGRGPHILKADSFDWYQLPPTPQKIATTLKLINVFIKELIETYPIDADKIYLLGFSQGSMMSLCYGLAFPDSISGIIAQSGAIPRDIGMEINRIGLQGKPVIITHGIEDPAMPISRGQMTRDTLRDFGCEVDYNEFHMGHTITNESLVSVKKWLEVQLRAS